MKIIVRRIPRLQADLICPRNIATGCWCIMADYPKTGKNNPNAVKFGHVIEHTLYLRPCKISATFVMLFMNNSGKKFEILSLYTSFCAV